MELLYIWIEDYKNIKEQGFNFSPLYDFEFKNNELTCKENAHAISTGTFFHEKGFIKNVTAIVGENGSGKSTVLDFIGEVYENNGNGFIVYREEVKKREYSFYYIGLNPNVEFMMTKLQTPLNTRVIYHNPIFSGYPINIQNNRSPDLGNIYSDTSTDCLASLEEKDYYYHELRRQLGFIDFINKKKEEGKEKVKDIEEITKFVPNNIYVYCNSPSGDIAFLNIKINIATSWFERLFYSFIFAIYDKIKSDYYSDDKVTEKTDEKETQKYLRKVLEKESIENVIEQISKNFKDKFIDFNDKVNEIKVLTQFLEDNKVQFGANEISQLLEWNFFNKYIAVQRNITNPILKFRWDFGGNKLGKLSSGETALLSIFGRLYATYLSKSEENFLLLLDEGEIGMHPHWQKQYLKILLDVLPIMFDGKKIQLILTSHSPFLVSDLPKENVIFLKKGSDGNCEVSDLASKEQTFGQNIHTLFADSFFMENNGGLMGEFAKGKIYELLSEIQQLEAINSEQKNTFVQRISIIGEPMIRESLLNLLESKFSDKDLIRFKIERMQTEITKLTNQLP